MYLFPVMFSISLREGYHICILDKLDFSEFHLQRFEETETDNTSESLKYLETVESFVIFLCVLLNKVS